MFCYFFQNNTYIYGILDYSERIEAESKSLGILRSGAYCIVVSVIKICVCSIMHLNVLGIE